MAGGRKLRDLLDQLVQQHGSLSESVDVTA